MDYKVSNYNWVVQKNNNTILYNSFSGSIVNLKNIDAKEFDFLTKCGKQISDKELTNLLIKHGFVIPTHVNEDLVLKKMFLEKINAQELLLVILPTEQCNFRCVYCYELFERTKLSSLNINEIKRWVETNIVKFSGVRVSWFGGEPLLAMSIIEELSEFFIQCCKINRIPYYSSITTNGYLLTRENWSKLKKCHITDIQLTIDGLLETHNKQRCLITGEDTWVTIMNNLYYFRDSIKTRTIRIMLRTNITKDIYEQRYQYLSFLQENFSDDDRFHFFFHLVMDWGNIKDNKIKEGFCSENELYQMMELAAEKGLKMPVIRSFLYPFSRVCFAAKRNAFVITSEGALRKCTQRLYDDQRNYLGLIKERNNIVGNREINCDLSVECTNCKMSPTCMGMVCPMYEGSKKDTCGADFSDIERLLKILVLSEKIGETEYE